MIVAILKFLFLIFIVFSVVLWIYSLVTWDGECHNDCNNCPYDDGQCRFKEERNDTGKRPGKPPGAL